jgi:hypothetical protein
MSDSPADKSLINFLFEIVHNPRLGKGTIDLLEDIVEFFKKVKEPTTNELLEYFRGSMAFPMLSHMANTKPDTESYATVDRITCIPQDDPRYEHIKKMMEKNEKEGLTKEEMDQLGNMMVRGKLDS